MKLSNVAARPQGGIGTQHMLTFIFRGFILLMALPLLVSAILVYSSISKVKWYIA